MRLTNVVYQGEMNCVINLKQLTTQLVNVRYDPLKFPGVIFQHRKIGGNCLIFSNGKINCNGACDSFDTGLKPLRRYARYIQRIGYDVVLTNVQPVTASAFHKLSSRLDVNSISPALNFSYDPELFPAVMMRRNDIHFTCHLSGSVLITGIKRPKDLDEIVYPTIVEIETSL